MFPRGLRRFLQKLIPRVPVKRRNSNMKKLAFLFLIVLCVSFATVASVDNANTFKATLREINETPGPVVTHSTAPFTSTFNFLANTLSYTDSYSNLNVQF